MRDLTMNPYKIIEHDYSSTLYKDEVWDPLTQQFSLRSPVILEYHLH